MLNDIASALDDKHPLVSLVQRPDENHVGFVAKMTYNEVTVLTNDKWRWRVGGIPQNSFLVATAFDPSNFSRSIPTERTVVLLRARGEATLPSDGDTYKAIIEHYQRKSDVQAADEFDGIEKISHSRLQFSGLRCHILGSYYTDESGALYMGSDVEDFYSLARLRVYKPTASALTQIVNYIDPRREAKAKKDAKDLLGTYPPPLTIGTVRYTSANPQQVSQKINVEVKIQPMDFLARRTAVLGMTRTGKSNTVKTTAGSVAITSAKAGVKIGQIIFDIKGEYANANGKDDGSSLAEALGTDVVRYRAAQKDGFKDLRDNFYQSLDIGLKQLQALIESSSPSRGQDMDTLVQLELSQPRVEDYIDEKSHKAAFKRWRKRVAIYKCLLHEAGLQAAPQDKTVEFDIGNRVYEQLHEHVNPDCAECTNKSHQTAHAKKALGDASTRLSLDDASYLFKTIRAANRQSELVSASGKPWLDQVDKGLLNLLVGKSDQDTNIRGTRVIGNVSRDWHSPTGSDDVPRDIYKNLIEGKVVIVDLSLGGTQETRQKKSESIAGYVYSQALRCAAHEQDPPLIMLYVEEAHNLIGKDSKIDTIWPKIGKEGAALNIGLMYCTQEPSSVHPNIMANTENFFVTHLNNDAEVRSISAYYDFSDFSDLIKGAQDVGFSRIKTLSSSFVIPAQIREFKPSSVKTDYENAKKASTQSEGL